MLERMYLKFCERKGFDVELLEESPGEVAGIKSADAQGERRVRLRRLAHRNRHSPARAEVAVRLERASPYFIRERCSCTPEVDDDIEIDNQSGGSARGYLPRERRRRPARQQDRLGHPHHAPAHEHRRRSARTSASSTEPRRRDGDAEGKLYELEVSKRKPRSRRCSRTARPTSAGATRSAPTCSISRASRICARSRGRQHAGGARRGSGAVHRGEPEAGRVIPAPQLAYQSVRLSELHATAVQVFSTIMNEHSRLNPRTTSSLKSAVRS